MFRRIFSNNVDLLKLMTKELQKDGKDLLIGSYSKEIQTLEDVLRSFLQGTSHKNMVSYILEKLKLCHWISPEEIIDLLINLCQFNNHGISFVQNHIHDMIFSSDKPLSSLLIPFEM